MDDPGYLHESNGSLTSPGLHNVMHQAESLNDCMHGYG